MNSNNNDFQISGLIRIFDSFEIEGRKTDQKKQSYKLITIVGFLILVVLLGGSIASFIIVSGMDEKINMKKDDRMEVRFATFNLSFDREQEGALATELQKPIAELPQQVKNIAAIIRINKPDIILLNEFNWDAENKGIKAFQKILNDSDLTFPSKMGAEPIDFPYFFTAETNTGEQPNPPFDFNGDGKTGKKGTREYGDDCFGYGEFPGKYGMAILSKYKIIKDEVRTFRKLLWKDMPNALLPDNPSTPKPKDFYSDKTINLFRISSKSHWDVPIKIGDKKVHVLASHPTPPTFDGPEDRNGRRNYDEIRLWVDYINQNKNFDYIKDDKGVKGGIEKGAKFVIMGDQNADPVNGDSYNHAAIQYLNSPFINTTFSPKRDDKSIKPDNKGTAGDYITDTAAFAGGLRVDYVLPSSNLEVVKRNGIPDAKVFWPHYSDPVFGSLIAKNSGDAKSVSSDHRLVYVTVKV